MPSGLINEAGKNIYLKKRNSIRFEFFHLGGFAVWLLLRTTVSEERSASFIRVIIGELETLAVTSN
jgi:hypothetical protein